MEEEGCGTTLRDLEGNRCLEVECRGESVFVECGSFCAEFDRVALIQAFRLELYGPGEIHDEAASALVAA